MIGKIIFLVVICFIGYVVWQLRPLFIKKKGSDPFDILDDDFGRFFCYFFPHDWEKMKKIPRKELKAKQIFFDDLKEKFSKKYPEYTDQIYNKFLKTYFGAYGKPR